MLSMTALSPTLAPYIWTAVVYHVLPVLEMIGLKKKHEGRRFGDVE